MIHIIQNRNIRRIKCAYFFCCIKPHTPIHFCAYRLDFLGRNFNETTNISDVSVEKCANGNSFQAKMNVPVLSKSEERQVKDRAQNLVTTNFTVVYSPSIIPQHFTSFWTKIFLKNFLEKSIILILLYQFNTIFLNRQ